MRALVTGAGGFIGKYLTQALLNRGNQVIEFNHQDHTLDNLGKLGNSIDTVFHLAAKTFIPESWEKPAEYINENTRILVDVLEHCKKKNIDVIYSSTYVYGNPEYLPIDEKHKCVSVSPYHLSKKLGEEICEFYCKNFDMNITVVRPFNVYGMGQKPDFIMPKIFYQVANPLTNKVEVMDLNPKRDYIYVEDLVDCIIRLSEHVNGFDVFNIGSGRSYSVKEIIDIIQDEFGTHKEITTKGAIRKNEVSDCVADISHLKSVIGNIRITSLHEGIHRWRMLER